MNSQPVIVLKRSPEGTAAPRRGPVVRVTLPPMSLFKTCFAKTPFDGLTLADLIAGIREGHWKAEVDLCRTLYASGDSEGYKSAKKRLPAVMLSARVERRGRGMPPEECGAIHSSLLQIDIDPGAHPGMDPGEIISILKPIPWIVAAYLSPSGAGVKAIARCPADFDQHAGSWQAAEAELARHGLNIDPATKDWGRLCFVSYDPEAWLREEPGETIVPVDIPEPAARGGSSGGTEDPEHVERVIADLAERKGRYQKRNTWLHILAATMGAVGDDTAAKIVDRYFPPKEDGHDTAAKTVRTLQPAAWESLRKYGIDPTDHLKDMPDCTGDECAATAGRSKGLSAFKVDHLETLGHSLAEIDALRPPAIIAGFLRQMEVLLLGAESKSRKSWLAQDAAIAVAAGVPWLADISGENGFATTKAGVHILDLELNPSEMQYRFAKARANRYAASIDGGAAMTSAVAAYSLDGLNVKDILILLEDLKAKVKRGDLVVIDCLYRLCPDGNEVKDLAAILEAVKRFASETWTGVIVVDHFRKAGDEKARNRFAGSFVKQASASTLVAIEVTADDVLVLNIDARTFHGCPKVHARFNPETYAFNRLPEIEVEKAKQASRRGEAEGWILRLWSGRATDSAVTAADAADRWGIKRQGAVPRLRKLVSSGWLIEDRSGAGRASKWTLAPDGVAVVKPDREDI